MRTRTIISLALAVIIAGNAAAALAGGRTISFTKDVTIGDARNAVADGITGATGDRNGVGILLPQDDPDQYRHGDWHILPLTGKVDNEPPKPGKTPGGKPGAPILPGFSPDGYWGGGKGEVEIKLACLTPGQNSLKVVNIGDGLVPAGQRFKWLVAKGGAGAFRLNRTLSPGETLAVPGYAGASGLPCAIKAI